MNEDVVYLPLVASRRDTGGRQAIAFATAAMRQALAVFHHTTLSLLRIKGHLLNWKVLIFLFCFSLQSIKYRNYLLIFSLHHCVFLHLKNVADFPTIFHSLGKKKDQNSMTSLRNGSDVTY